jgi:hypothetical protein
LSASIPFSEALRLDEELVRLARGASALRLDLGTALDALSSREGHHALGFSSFEAYARERCARTARWATDTRKLCRRLAGLPHTREALREGAIGWSTAELLARQVSAHTEREWLEKARTATVRELRTMLAPMGDNAGTDESDDDASRTLTVTATREDSWLFEGTRKVAEAVAGVPSVDRLLEVLLAEGFSTLLELVPDCSALQELEGLESELSFEADAQAAWCAQLQRWRSNAEAICERQAFLERQEAAHCARAPGELSDSPELLDREIRRLASELAERDLALGIVAESARRAQIWHRLGFSSEAQYARERVGLSLSSLKAKRILAARAARVPEVATALSSGRIGYEAAYLLSRVATARTAPEWIARAERRTVKHLREEVEAAELLVRVGQPRDQLPLDEQCLDALFELERFVVSGERSMRAPTARCPDPSSGNTPRVPPTAGPDSDVSRCVGA